MASAFKQWITLKDLGKVNWNLLKGFTILEAIKNIHDSEEDVKIETLTQLGKKLIPISHIWLWGIQDSVQEIAIHMLGIEEN